MSIDVAMDDRRDRVEEGEGVGAGRRADRFGQRHRGQRAGGDDRQAGGGEGVDPLADDLDIGMGGEPLGHRRRKAVAVDRQRRSGRHPVGVRRRHDQRAERAHLGMEQPDRIVLGIVRAEAVRADQFGEAVGLVRRRRLAGAAHFRQAHRDARLGELPGRLGSGEAAADDMDLGCHRGCDSHSVHEEEAARCGFSPSAMKAPPRAS